MKNFGFTASSLMHMREARCTFLLGQRWRKKEGAELLRDSAAALSPESREGCLSNFWWISTLKAKVGQESWDLILLPPVKQIICKVFTLGWCHKILLYTSPAAESLGKGIHLPISNHSVADPNHCQISLTNKGAALNWLPCHAGQHSGLPASCHVTYLLLCKSIYSSAM